MTSNQLEKGTKAPLMEEARHSQHSPPPWPCGGCKEADWGCGRLSRRPLRRPAPVLGPRGPSGATPRAARPYGVSVGGRRKELGGKGRCPWQWPFRHAPLTAPPGVESRAEGKRDGDKRRRLRAAVWVSRTRGARAATRLKEEWVAGTAGELFLAKRTRAKDEAVYRRDSQRDSKQRATRWSTRAHAHARARPRRRES